MPAIKGRRGNCAVCSHADQQRIELMLAAGGGQKAIARKFGVSKDSVWRHWTRHVSPERRATLLMGPVQKHALAAQIAEENTSVLDNLRIVRAGLYRQYDNAIEAGDRTAGALLAGKLHQNLQITARITGELASSPLVQINNQQNVSMMMESPEFSAFQAQLIAVLRDFPEARLAVIREFSKLEALSTEDTSASAAPQLIQQGEVHEETEAAA